MKFVSKIASDLEKPDGLVVVRPGEVVSFLHPLPIKRLWGVGPRTRETLESMGIRTIGQLRRFSLDRLSRTLGEGLAEHIHNLARGVDELVTPDCEPLAFYRRENVEKRLAELCPNGIDVFFDNVGGDILDIALDQLADTLRSKAGAAKTPGVLLFADNHITYQTLYNVIDQIKLAGIDRLSLECERHP